MNCITYILSRIRFQTFVHYWNSTQGYNNICKKYSTILTYLLSPEYRLTKQNSNPFCHYFDFQQTKFIFLENPKRLCGPVFCLFFFCLLSHEQAWFVRRSNFAFEKTKSFTNCSLRENRKPLKFVPRLLTALFGFLRSSSLFRFLVTPLYVLVWSELKSLVPTRVHLSS